jgi:hypothetical protein
VTTAFVVVVVPAAVGLLFFLNFFPITKNKMPRIAARIQRAIKPTMISFVVDQPENYKNQYANRKILSSSSSYITQNPCEDNDLVLLSD